MKQGGGGVKEPTKLYIYGRVDRESGDRWKGEDNGPEHGGGEEANRVDAFGWEVDEEEVWEE